MRRSLVLAVALAASYTEVCSAEGAGRSGCAWNSDQRVSAAEVVSHMTKYVPLRMGLYRNLNLDGTVRLLLGVSETGTVGCIEVVSGWSMVTGAALDAAKQWQFVPFTKGRHAIRVESIVTVEYHLHNEQQRSEVH